MNKLYCYSHTEFDMVMKDGLGLSRDTTNTALASDNIAIISICDSDLSRAHYFFNADLDLNNKEELRAKDIPDAILNIEFDDSDPDEWKLDFPLDLDLATDKDFVHSFEDGHTEHALDYTKAKAIVMFILKNLGKDFYIHCSAGKSRSQGVVRFILDEFPEFRYQTRIENPPLYPNMHVLRMLKRAYMKDYYTLTKI